VIKAGGGSKTEKEINANPESKSVSLYTTLLRRSMKDIMYNGMNEWMLVYIPI